MRFLRVGGHEMAYVEEGAGAPLLLVHGALADLRFWAPLLGGFVIAWPFAFAVNRAMIPFCPRKRWIMRGHSIVLTMLQAARSR